jgi:serine/threonine protein kinase
VLGFVHTQCLTFLIFFSLDSNHELYFVVLQPAAMFKVLHTDPPIPDNMSPEGKDFLRCCLKRNPTERPTATKLLEHPFIRTSNHYSPRNSFLGIKSPVSM